jgi:hypothetical protein
MPRLRGEKVSVYVPITVNNFKYGYKTNRLRFNAVGAELGQLNALGVAGVFYGCNKPKPGTARKTELNAGSISGFYDYGKRDALKAAGWNLSASGKLPSIKTTGASITVAVPTPFGYDYAWLMTRGEFPTFEQAGVFKPTVANKLVFGSFPKPPRGSITVGGERSTSFVPPDAVSIAAAADLGFSVTGLDDDWT